MEVDSKKHHRRSLRLREYDYARVGAYFVTMCTAQRNCLFDGILDGHMRLNRFGEIADECWQAIPGHFEDVELGAFVVMPDHFHGIVVITPAGATDIVGAAHASPQHPNGPKPHSLGAIIGSYKSAVSKRINEIAVQGGPVWQRNCYEHIIRDEAELRHIHKYILRNPARWGEKSASSRSAIDRRQHQTTGSHEIGRAGR